MKGSFEAMTRKLGLYYILVAFAVPVTENLWIKPKNLLSARICTNVYKSQTFTSMCLLYGYNVCRLKTKVCITHDNSWLITFMQHESRIIILLHFSRVVSGIIVELIKVTVFVITVSEWWTVIQAWPFFLKWIHCNTKASLFNCVFFCTRSRC